MARLNGYDRPIEAELDGEFGDKILRNCPQVERRSNLTLAEFDAEYRIPGRPVVLTGVGPEWPAWKKWTMDFFRQQYGRREVITAVYSKTPRTERMADVIDRIVSHDPAHGQIPPYLQEWPVDVEARELMKDFVIPEYFQRNWLAEKLEGPSFRMWIGPKGAVTWLHQDVINLHTWNAQISGKKLWFLFGANSKPVNTGEKFDHDEFLNDPLTQARYYISAPGEILYNPKRGWHRVKTLESSINLSGHFLDEVDVPILVKDLKISNCLGWLNAEKVDRTDPGLAATFRHRARIQARALGLDPNDILGIDKEKSANTIMDLIHRNPAEVTNA